MIAETSVVFRDRKTLDDAKHVFAYDVENDLAYALFHSIRQPDYVKDITVDDLDLVVDGLWQSRIAVRAKLRELAQVIVRDYA
jgi:hypothetical protein